MSETPPRRFAPRPWAAAAALGCCALAAWYLAGTDGLPQGVSREAYARAELRFRDLYRRQPDRVDVFSLLGESAAGEGQLSTALACFREVPSEHPRYGPAARLQEAQVLARLSRAAEAEDCFREFLTLARSAADTPREHLVAAYKWLGYLLSVELRFEERKELLAEMHAAGLADVFDSKQFYFPHLLIWHTSTGADPVEAFLQQTPDDLLLRIAAARYRTYAGRPEAARELLADLHRRNAGDLRCTAALLECDFERNDWPAFGEVAAGLPEAEDGEPWLLTRMRGEFAAHEGRWGEAARHFRRLLEADPANPWCYTGLARASAELGLRGEREDAVRRSLALARIRSMLGNVTEHDAAASAALASACEEAGLAEAAGAFRQHARRIAGSRTAVAPHHQAR